MKLDKLNPKKASQATNIPNKVIEEIKDLVGFYIKFSNFLFPKPLKYVKPTYKRVKKTYKTNYRPISILPVISKVYKRLMDNQLYPHFDNICSTLQCGFRKGYNAQHCLMFMIEK